MELLEEKHVFAPVKITWDELLRLKTITGLVHELGTTIKFTVKVCLGAKMLGDDWIDCDCIELHGRWEGRKIRSDSLFNQADIDSLQQNISFT